ncbi:MAG: BREX-1 system phosphatase PglZ type A, partial [Candidatus Omnitrophica bacterium]|nr:BREX-1 system phosphatase PglZ type A [Candidatus Omnitrophota bacterium]
EAKKVDVVLTNTSKKITNNIFTLNFFQTEKISPKMLPRKLRISLWDEQGKQVSTDEVIHADRISDLAENRTFSILLKLMSGIQNGKYNLRLIDDDTQMEYESIAFDVNVGIMSDFEDF